MPVGTLCPEVWRLDLDREANAVAAGALRLDLAELEAVAQDLETLGGRLVEQFELFVKDRPCVIAIVYCAPAVGERHVLGGLALLEFVGSPAGLVVELQPLGQRGHAIGLLVVREQAGWISEKSGPEKRWLVNLRGWVGTPPTMAAGPVS